MFIEQLKIKNFKGFSEESFQFKDHFTVIIGNWKIRRRLTP